jgi:hypothetical protein
MTTVTTFLPEDDVFKGMPISDIAKILTNDFIRNKPACAHKIVHSLNSGNGWMMNQPADGYTIVGGKKTNDIKKAICFHSTKKHQPKKDTSKERESLNMLNIYIGQKERSLKSELDDSNIVQLNEDLKLMKEERDKLKIKLSELCNPTVHVDLSKQPIVRGLKYALEIFSFNKKIASSLLKYVDFTMNPEGFINKHKMIEVRKANYAHEKRTEEENWRKSENKQSSSQPKLSERDRKAQYQSNRMNGNLSRQTNKDYVKKDGNNINSADYKLVKDLMDKNKYIPPRYRNIASQIEAEIKESKTYKNNVLPSRQLKSTKTQINKPIVQSEQYPSLSPQNNKQTKITLTNIETKPVIKLGSWGKPMSDKVKEVPLEPIIRPQSSKVKHIVNNNDFYSDDDYSDECDYGHDYEDDYEDDYGVNSWD